MPNEPHRLGLLELEKIISLNEAAALSGISIDGLRRHYPHLIRKLSPRRVGVKLRDVLAIGDDIAAA